MAGELQAITHRSSRKTARRVAARVGPVEHLRSLVSAMLGLKMAEISASGLESVVSPRSRSGAGKVRRWRLCEDCNGARPLRRPKVEKTMRGTAQVACRYLKAEGSRLARLARAAHCSDSDRWAPAQPGPARAPARQMVRDDPTSRPATIPAPAPVRAPAPGSRWSARWPRLPARLAPRDDPSSRPVRQIFGQGSKRPSKVPNRLMRGSRMPARRLTKAER